MKTIHLRRGEARGGGEAARPGQGVGAGGASDGRLRGVVHRCGGGRRSDGGRLAAAEGAEAAECAAAAAGEWAGGG